MKGRTRVCQTCLEAVCCPYMEMLLRVTFPSTADPVPHEAMSCAEYKCSRRPAAVFSSLIFNTQSIFISHCIYFIAALVTKLQTVLFNIQHPAFGINSVTLSVSLIHILVFHLLTTLQKSDPHCHHHLCHHQSLLFFTLDLKHISSSSLIHRRLHHRYSLD